MARQVIVVLITRASITLIVVLLVTLVLPKGLDLFGPGGEGGALQITQIITVIRASSIGTQALIVVNLWLLALHQVALGLAVEQEEPASLVKLPQVTTGEQDEEGKGYHLQLPQQIGHLGYKLRPREGLLILMPASIPTLTR